MWWALPTKIITDWDNRHNCISPCYTQSFLGSFLFFFQFFPGKIKHRHFNSPSSDQNKIILNCPSAVNMIVLRRVHCLMPEAIRIIRGENHWELRHLLWVQTIPIISQEKYLCCLCQPRETMAVQKAKSPSADIWKELRDDWRCYAL